MTNQGMDMTKSATPLMRLRRKLGWVGLGAVVTVLATSLASPAAAQVEIKRKVIAGGGASATTGGVYRLSGTIGQCDPGQMAGGPHTLRGGFWHGGSYMVAVDPPGIEVGVPLAFALRGGSPNPLVRQSSVAFDLPQANSVHMRIYDANGRVMRTLVEGRLPAGHHQRTWDGADDAGHLVAAGVYFIRLESETHRATQKIAVLR